MTESKSGSAAPPKPRPESYWIIEWRFPSHAGKQFDWQPIGNPPFITELDAKKFPMRGYYEYKISEFVRERRTDASSPK